MIDLVLIAHNLRSAHNVGSLLRTADGLGVESAYLSGHTPYPQLADDRRLPHEIKKATAQIAKTALGAEKSLRIFHEPDVLALISKLRTKGYDIVALEQHPEAIDLANYKPGQKTALIIGNEVEGIEPAILDKADKIVQIPMRGQKESLNAAIAGAIAIYTLVG